MPLLQSLDNSDTEFENENGYASDDNSIEVKGEEIESSDDDMDPDDMNDVEDQEENEEQGGGGAEDSENDDYLDNSTEQQYKNIELSNQEDDDQDDEDEDENYLMKFDKEIRKNYLVDFHPETVINNFDEIQSLVNIIRDKRGVIIDDFHKTIPFLTKYEKTRVLGQRTKQINSGSKPYLDKSMLIHNGKPIIDGYLIALKELEQKKIPFIIRRPLPNGASEYWRLEDLELIN